MCDFVNTPSQLNQLVGSADQVYRTLTKFSALSAQRQDTLLGVVRSTLHGSEGGFPRMLTLREISLTASNLDKPPAMTTPSWTTLRVRSRRPSWRMLALVRRAFQSSRSTDAVISRRNVETEPHEGGLRCGGQVDSVIVELPH